MTTRAEILEELQSFDGTLARLHAELEAGGVVDLAALESRVGALCSRVATLTPDDGRRIRPRLIALLDDFDRLTGSIEAALAELRQRLGDTAGRRQAVSAYAKHSGR